TVSNDLLVAGPSGVEAIPSHTDNEVLVTFTGVPGATGYTVYRQTPGDAQFTQAGTTNMTWFIDNGAQAGTDYRYVVTATVPQTQGGSTVNVETAASYPALASPGPIASPAGPFNSYDVGTNF